MRPFPLQRPPGTARPTGWALAVFLRKPSPILFICGLVGLLMVCSCSKNTFDAKIIGSWRLVAFNRNGNILYSSSDTNRLELNPDHTYVIRSGSRLLSSGTYFLDITLLHANAILYFSDGSYTPVWDVTFHQDTMRLMAREVDIDWGAAVNSYVRR